MYLVDTNIFLEVFLNQEKADEAKSFLDTVPSDSLFVSDFTLHTIGVILFRLKKPELYPILMTFIFHRQIKILSIDAVELCKIANLDTGSSLDFDDAYQYYLAEKNNLQIVSFDAHFDKTKRGRKEPSNI